MNCSICLELLENLYENKEDTNTRCQDKNNRDIDRDTYSDINDKTPLLFINKVKKYSKNKNKNKSDKEDTNLEDSIKTLICGHKFHTECINEWINENNSCPYCRRIIKDYFNVTIAWSNLALSFSKYKASIKFPIDYPDKRTFDVVVEFNNKRKQNIVLNKYSVKEFRVLKNKIVLSYFNRYPDIIDILYIDFKNNEEHQFTELLKKNFSNHITMANVTDELIDNDELIQNSLF